MLLFPYFSFQCILHKQDPVVLISNEIVVVPSSSFYIKVWQMGARELQWQGMKQ